VDEDTEIRDNIQQIALDMPCYGYRRITVALRRMGCPVNHKRVLRLMREDNLLCLRKRRFVRTTNSDHGLPVYPNLVPGMVLDGINQLWVSDITYIRLRREFVYLAVILDAYSRRCLGFSLGRRLDHRLALEAFRKAIDNRDIEPGIVHHSDRGVQYACKEYTDLLKENGFRISMSRVGNPYDNAFAESFIKTLKQEEVYLWEYENMTDACSSIASFIDEVYNLKRLHSSLGYLPPVEFEQAIGPKQPVSP
jgi:transposase InsO family protein